MPAVVEKRALLSLQIARKVAAAQPVVDRAAAPAPAGPALVGEEAGEAEFLIRVQEAIPVPHAGDGRARGANLQV